MSESAGAVKARSLLQEFYFPSLIFAVEVPKRGRCRNTRFRQPVPGS